MGVKVRGKGWGGGEGFEPNCLGGRAVILPLLTLCSS